MATVDWVDIELVSITIGGAVHGQLIEKAEDAALLWVG